MIGILECALVDACYFPLESPRWLISNAKFNQARVSLQKIRGDDNVDSELSAIQADCQDYASFSSCTLLWSSGVPKALVLGCALQVRCFVVLNQDPFFSNGTP